MAFDGILTKEIFHSIQGETSLSGLRFAFVRLSGCNLRCSYCDSAHAFHGGDRKSIESILDEIKPFQVEHVLLTGGEPLLQRNTPDLVKALNEAGYKVSIETHGEVSIEAVAQSARIIMDIKCPASGMSRGGFRRNLPLLKPSDEVKFVLASKSDYFWARSILENEEINCREVLMSAAISAKGAPNFSESSAIHLQWLAEQIITDKLNVRLQTQIHKVIWGPDKIGV